MAKAIDLMREGRDEELWQKCCGFLSLNTREFMEVQERLLLKQLELLNNCALGERIFGGKKPKTVEEFRKIAPLTTYKEYCPELLEQREDILPAKPEQWVHTSGRSGEYPCKWIPLSHDYTDVLSEVSYGCGIFSGCKGLGDVSQMSECPKIVYAVAPRPYMSGAMAAMLELQTPSKYLPPLEISETLPFEERIQLGFKQALNTGFDYFFGLSLVLVAVGIKFSQASSTTSIFPLLKQPRALFRLAKGMIKSKLARRAILPRDLWDIKGIISGGLDSTVYKERIKEFWGRYPLDIYGGTEIGIIATQTWEYEDMSFVPNLNFLEFIPDEEHLKWQLDRSYQPKTVLLDEVEVGKEYEIVVTNFHGGAMIRYKPGDMIRITSLYNDKLGVQIPQMTFVGRADDIIDFGVIRLTEKVIWQAIEDTGIPYEDWIVQKELEGTMVLHLMIELKEGYQATEKEVAAAVYNKILESDANNEEAAEIRRDFENVIDFKVEVSLLPSGTFAEYTNKRRSEGADLAHLKPPHINPSEQVLTVLVAKKERAKVESEAEIQADSEAEKTKI